MNAYTGFATVYDLFMDNIPYEEWERYVFELLKDYRITGGILLDLGCGTGSLTELLSFRGYEMIGIDNSEEMLLTAIEKKERSQQDILYLLQDMRSFELYGTVDGVVSICDSINYILEYQELVKVFSLVNNYLNPEGIFIFDCNTFYKYQYLLGDNVIAEDRDECSFIWDNYFDSESGINEYVLSLFIKTESDLYRKYEEVHYQKAYTLEQLKQALYEAGMEYVTAYDAFTKNSPREDSERVYIIAREKGKRKE